VARGETVGLVRILLDGTPSASIAVKGRAAITSIAEAEACRQGLDVIGARPGAFLGEVLLIHDGAVGREAWRLEVLERGRRTGWVFVTPGGVYERGVNERPPDDARE
jgi:hypothetical protein